MEVVSTYVCGRLIVAYVNVKMALSLKRMELYV